jgi:iron-sulfur cluster assembly accessory protein
MKMSQELLVTLTPGAIEAARTLRAGNPEWAGFDLRVYLSAKGCDGFEYGVSFDSRQDLDLVAAFDDVITIIDLDTAKYVRGSTIDWIDDERGRGFVVENPNHKKFRGKFFKRKDWEERLS